MIICASVKTRDMVDGYPLMLNASDGYTSPYYWINESYSLIWVYTIIYPPTFDHVTTTSIRRCEKDVPWRNLHHVCHLEKISDIDDRWRHFSIIQDP